jgi:hypothetical protein
MQRKVPNSVQVNGKVVSVLNCTQRYEDVWDSECIDPSFLTSALIRGERSASRPCQYPTELFISVMKSSLAFNRVSGDVVALLV